MSPQRIQRRRTEGWRMPEGAIYVGRPSRWGNPFVVGGTARVWHLPGGTQTPGQPDITTGRIEGVYLDVFRVGGADHAARLFRSAMTSDPEWWRPDKWTRPDLTPLAGHDLACRCPLDSPCHADVLLELANGGVS